MTDMTNFEYFIWLLQENENLVDLINSLDIDLIPVIANEVICDAIANFIEEE